METTAGCKDFGFKGIGFRAFPADTLLCIVSADNPATRFRV